MFQTEIGLFFFSDKRYLEGFSRYLETFFSIFRKCFENFRKRHFGDYAARHFPPKAGFLAAWRMINRSLAAKQVVERESLRRFLVCFNILPILFRSM